MRIMLDTNVLISMILFPGKRFMQMLEVITQRHTLVLSSFVVDELMAVADRKFPAKKDAIDLFYPSWAMSWSTHRAKYSRGFSKSATSTIIPYYTQPS